MDKKFNYQRVEICWMDICNADGAWLTEAEVLNHTLAECISVGFLFSKSRNKQEQKKEKKNFSWDI